MYHSYHVVVNLALFITSLNESYFIHIFNAVLSLTVLNLLICAKIFLTELPMCRLRVCTQHNFVNQMAQTPAQYAHKFTL